MLKHKRFESMLYYVDIDIDNDADVDVVVHVHAYACASVRIASRRLIGQWSKPGKTGRFSSLHVSTRKDSGKQPAANLQVGQLPCIACVITSFFPKPAGEPSAE